MNSGDGEIATRLTVRSRSPRACLWATYWHGGMPGMLTGDYLLPPTELNGIARATTMHAIVDHSLLKAAHYRPDRVYVTTNPDQALIFAGGMPNGVVYQVRPFGFLDDDPDFTGTPCESFTCARALIIDRVAVPRHLRRVVRQALMDGDHRD